MSITYTNRKGQIYYLHQGKTKTGKPRYHFSQKDKGQLIDTIPDGYEIYENPNAQVFLRKIPKKIITDAEVAIAEQGIQKYCKLPYFIIDVKKDILSIYTLRQDLGEMVDRLSTLSIVQQDRTTIEKQLAGHLNYTCDMRFVLLNKQSRTFQTQRFCYLGSIDDWIEIGPPNQLEPLIKTYVKHIGQDSIYELHF